MLFVCLSGVVCFRCLLMCLLSCLICLCLFCLIHKLFFFSPICYVLHVFICLDLFVFSFVCVSLLYLVVVSFPLFCLARLLVVCGLLCYGVISIGFVD